MGTIFFFLFIVVFACIRIVPQMLLRQRRDINRTTAGGTSKKKSLSCAMQSLKYAVIYHQIRIATSGIV